MSSSSWVLAAMVLAVLFGCGRDSPQGGREVSARAVTVEKAPSLVSEDELRRCTDKPVVDQAVMSTTGGCYGFVQWDVVEGFELDVSRYATIVEIEVTHSEEVAKEKRITSDVRVNTRRVTAAVRGVIKGTLGGAGARTRARFVVADTAAWSSAWGKGKRRVRGAVFLPSNEARINDLGCIESHFVAYDSKSSPTFARDLRAVGGVLHRQPDRASIERGAALELARDGGFLAGMFLAEFAPLDVVLSLVQDPRSTRPSLLQMGLDWGLIRMRRLVAVPNYPRQWDEPQLRDAVARMGRWAIVGLLLPDRPRHAVSWILDAQAVLSDVTELSVPRVTREALALREPGLADWLRGATVDAPRERLRDLLPPLEVRRRCGERTTLSPSHMLIRRGY